LPTSAGSAVTDANGQRKPAVAEAEQVMYESLKRGLNFKVTMGNVLTLTPALTITQAELDQALDILDEAIGKAEAKEPDSSSRFSDVRS